MNPFQKLLEAARKYTMCDFAVFKITLILIGVLIGGYGVLFFARCIWVVWALALVGVVYLAIRTINKVNK